MPLIAAAVAVPFVYKRLTAADFGIFTLALTALGLFSVMDFGIGRGTVRFVSRALGEGSAAESALIAGQSVLVLGALSLALCVAFAALLPRIALRWVPDLGNEAGRLGYVIGILAVSIPFVGVASSLRSVLEAHERFPVIAAIQGVMGALTYVVPMLCVTYTPDIRIVVAGAVAARVLGLGFYLLAARPFCRFGVPWASFRTPRTRQFLAFSGWLVISNIVGNTVVYSDRALLTRLVPLGRLAYYNVPLEFLTRLMIVVNGAISVAFPLLSRVSSDAQRLDRLHSLGIAVLGACAAPVLLVCSIFAPWALDAWLGSDFRAQSTEVVRILIVGLLCLSLNALTLASLNARGISRVVALMHVTEAPLYIWALWFFGSRDGIEGLAFVWSARMGFELACFVVMQMVVSTNRGLLLCAALLGALQVIPAAAVAVNRAVVPSVLACAAITCATIVWIRAVLGREFVPRPGT